MELTNITQQALDKYFNFLSHSGYKSYSEVNNLLILTFLEELLCGQMSEYLTIEDRKLISTGLQCILGSCMIPYSSNVEININERLIFNECN